MSRFLVLLVFFLSACGGGGGDSSPPQQTSAPVPSYPLKSGQFSQVGPLLGAKWLVEASYHLSPNTLFVGCADDKTCVMTSRADPNPPLALSDACRFQYPFSAQGAHFLACHRGGDIYLYRSSDLTTWVVQNNGVPILRRTPGTHWANVWNVAILPVGDRWHMLAESSATQDRMDIAYAWVDPSVSLDFTPNQGPVVIRNGGNPEMFLKNGAMYAVHGMYRDRSPTDPWYVTLSTASPTSPLSWTVHRDRLLIEQPGIDVCDPSYIEVDGKGLLLVSYDQNKVLEMSGPPLN